MRGNVGYDGSVKRERQRRRYNESEARRSKPKGTLESEIVDRNAHCDIVVRTAPSAPYWCGKVVIDRRGNQVGNVLVCLDAVTIQFG